MLKFSKKEKLCSRKDIEKLFSDGQIFNQYPFKVFYFTSSYKTNYPAQVAFMVSKKLFKNAVDRNLIKRRMREAYRLNKETLYNYLIDNELYLTISIIYIDKEIKDFEFMRVNIIKVIDKIKQIAIIK